MSIGIASLDTICSAATSWRIPENHTKASTAGKPSKVRRVRCITEYHQYMTMSVSCAEILEHWIEVNSSG